ncbi:uncharacterized protein MELLADRAFT_102983 [Melampsora larici-populina 98AG31]|uniref:Uncharacterized protein n=1 Tax=Melampsora larici-populina (strain 98AG31 / pathotype 3-4-7) TaxID=747676 RepID=F4RA62_MELLP|nr:uncharacterized protein MELLADRAFT_102983 [Melampsora larici-populina 98AG31]EGG10425.1 hypothetical protein MELLADRAFT_102983 [Melampsora larici-populina 98AG31]
MPDCPLLSFGKGERMAHPWVVLPPKPTNNAAQVPNLVPPLPRDGHPFLGRVEEAFTPFENQRKSLAGPHRSSKVAYPYQRASRGPVAWTHRTTGNKSCAYQYCQACCLEFGLTACLKHVRRPDPHITHWPASVTTPIHLPTPSTSQPPVPLPPQAVQPHAAPARIHQWAQSANSLGHRLGVQAVSAIQIDRCEQYEAMDRRANRYEERKVVTIHLWLDLKAFNTTHEAPARSDVETSQADSGSGHKALQPDSLQSDPNEVVVVNGKGSHSQPYVREKVCKEPTPTPVSTLQSHHADEDEDKGSTDDVIFVSKNYRAESELPEFDPMYRRPSATTGTKEISDNIPDEDSSQTATPVLTNPTPVTAKKKGWPLSSSLITKLLAWYRDCEIRAPLQAWKDTFGSEWHYARLTVYRYKNWIDRVTYTRFAAKYVSLPCATVGEARDVFKKEFKAVS